jgi:hypothetical protein
MAHQQFQFLNFNDFNFKDILQETVKKCGKIFYSKYIGARPYLKPGGRPSGYIIEIFLEVKSTVYLPLPVPARPLPS